MYAEPELPPPEPSTSGPQKAVGRLEAAFDALLGALIAALALALGVIGLILAFTDHWAWGLLALVPVVAGLSAFRQRRRRQSPRP